MNDVLNPFQITHPTAIQTSLLATALLSKFDPTGRWIAAGKQNGSVVIWDLETKAPVRVLDGHVRGVTSIDWSRYGRYVVSASKDWNVIVWDLASRFEPMQRWRTVRFDSPVVSASFHPRNSKIILVLLSTGEAFIADMRKVYRGRVELCDVQEQEEGEEEGGGGGHATVVGGGQNGKRSAMTVASFDMTGRYVFVGTSNGMLLVFNTRTKVLVGRHKIAGAGVMKSLDFTRNGRRLVTNSSDRILRQFTIPNYQATPDKVNEQEFEPTHRFNDPINRTAWHVMSYSPDGEWLAGGSADPATHKIYIWDLSNDGRFSTALDGGREPLAHIHWHPRKSLIASTTTHGNILIWHYPEAERWGAFAGGFEEVDENIEYEERENEFDIEDEETIRGRKTKAEEEDIDIDVLDEVSDSSPTISKRVLSGSASASKPPSASASASAPTSTSNSHNNTSTGASSAASKDGKDVKGSKEGKGAMKGVSKGTDEDVAWAEEEPDEDVKGWKMRVSKSGAELAEEIGV